MEEYDVVVVGAGPCGSSAAKKAAEAGMKTIMLEEHAEIGMPEHCPGVLAKTASGFLEELVDMIDQRAVVSRLRALRIYAPSGRMVETTPEKTSVFARVERKLFDRELARLAANAGAGVVVSTGVTSLIKEDGIVRGVNTNSKEMPEVYGKVVISAQGYRAQMTGVPKWEGLTRPSLRFSPPMLTLHVTGVKDIDPAVVEFHLGYGSIFPCDNVSCLAGARNLSDFEELKAKNWLISKKLRDCKVLGIRGWAGNPIPEGAMLRKKVKDGLILAGDAAGFIGIETAIASGRLAGEVAAEAVKAGDVTEKKLSKYEGLCQELAANIELFNRQWDEVMQYNRLPEDEIEKRFREREPDVLGTLETLTPSYVMRIQSSFGEGV